MARADRVEEHTSHLKGIVRDMMSTLSMCFGVMDFEDMLARIPASASASAPTLALAPAPDDDDDDVDLGDF